MKPGVDKVLEVAMHSMDELFGLAHASAYLVDPERGDLVLTARRGKGGRDQHKRFRIGQGMVGTAAAKREIVRLNFARDQAIESHLAIPLR